MEVEVDIPSEGHMNALVATSLTSRSALRAELLMIVVSMEIGCGQKEQQLLARLAIIASNLLARDASFLTSQCQDHDGLVARTNERAAIC